MSKRRKTVEVYSKPYPVEVSWVDAISMHRWESPSGHARLDGAPVKSVGYLLQRDAKVLVLVQSQSTETGQVGDSVAIPAGCVRRVRQLR